MSPFYTKGDTKLVRKPVEQVYGKEDYQTIKTVKPYTLVECLI